MPLEQNLDAARAANALVLTQLGIQSSNRPTDHRPPDFMNDLQPKKDELADDLAQLKKSAREGKLREQIEHVEKELATKSHHRKTLVDSQKEMTKDIDNLEDEARKKRMAEVVEIGKQVSAVMTIENRLKKELSGLEDELQGLLTGRLNMREDIEVTAQASVDLKKGNCDEMSSVAYLFLRSTRIRPIDLFETGVIKKGPDQIEDRHQFVVIGRKASEHRDNPAAWADDAVVCDPWENAAYQARDLHQHLKTLGYPSNLSLRMRDESADIDADD